MNEDAEVIARKAGMKGWGIFMFVLGSLCAVFLIVAEVLKMQGDEDYPAVFAALYIILALALLAISAGYCGCSLSTADCRTTSSSAAGGR